MNRIELGQWLQYHDSLFPGYLNWFQTGEPAAISVRMEAWGQAARIVQRVACPAGKQRVV